MPEVPELAQAMQAHDGRLTLRGLVESVIRAVAVDMDAETRRAVVDRLMFDITRLTARPNLGLATTRELLAEISARIEIDYANGGGGLDYSTVSGRPLVNPWAPDGGNHPDARG
jgi:hypothetical protein